MKTYQDTLFKPCVGCGMCCKHAPCGYGKWDYKNHRCIHLKEKEKINEFQTYECRIYEFIIKQPGAEFSPAFNTGCSSTFLNTDRNNIIRRLKENYSMSNITT
jgi:Fe-S-cluster containining protein